MPTEKRAMRFLDKKEYVSAKELTVVCFGNDDGFFDGYYAPKGIISSGRIAVMEENGRIVSMIHLLPLTAEAESGEEKNVTYLLCVATAPDCRHRGYMAELMRFVTDTLKAEGEPWTFLVAVDKAIYRGCGFTIDWEFDPRDAELLCADEGLTECSTKLLNETVFRKPKKLMLREKSEGTETKEETEND